MKSVGRSKLRRRISAVLVGSMVASILVLGAGPAQASHGRYFHVNWKKTAANTAEFTVTESYATHWFSSTIAVGDTINETYLEYGDGQGQSVASKVVSINEAEGWLVARSDPFTHTFPGAGPYKVGYTSCCTIYESNNVSSMDWSSYTLVDFSKDSESPVATVPPIVPVGNSGVQSWTVHAYDNGGHTLRWRLATPEEACSTGSPCSDVVPPGLSIDQNTGEVTWDTTGRAEGLWFTSVIIEALNGAGDVVSWSQVTYLIKVGVPTTNQAPVWRSPTPADGAEVNVAPGSAASISLKADDADTGQDVTLSHIGLPVSTATGANAPAFSQTTGNPSTGTFTWTPTSADIGNHFFTVVGQDNGEPVLSTGYRTFKIVVADPPPATHTLQVSKDGSGSGTVTSSPAGIDCGSDCSQDYGNATVVTLTATAASGSAFAGWTGCGTPSGNTCEVTMDGAKSVNATFDVIPPTKHTLSVTRDGTGDGSVSSNPAGISCGLDCTEQYDENTVVTLTASPQAGSTFVGWSGCGSATGGECTVSMTAAKSVTATFATVATNTDPVINDDSTEALTGEKKTITLTAQDPDGDGLTFDVTTDPTKGTVGNVYDVVCDAGSCTAKVDYTPSTTATGDDTFVVTVDDGKGGTDTATITVQLSCGTIIDNGTVQLGVWCLGHLNVPGGTPSAGVGTESVGLRLVGTNNDGTAPGCACEGWGIADATSGVSGYANESKGISTNLTPLSFNTTATTAVSKVQIGTTFEVTQDYHPHATNANMYENTITVKNISSSATDLRYRRVMDWDVEPTAFEENVTVNGGSASALLYSSNDGFATADPLGSRNSGDVSPTITGNFTDAGPSDHGALFDFGFGSLAPGATKTFKIYYGAAANETQAVKAVADVNGEVFSFGQPSTEDGPTLGTPNTFIFAFAGVGGHSVFKPAAQAQTVNINEDSGQKQVTLSGTHYGTGTLAFTLVNGPAHGTVTGITGVTCTGSSPRSCTANIAYTPDPNFNGTDSFTFRVSDGTDVSNATVTVNVAPVNDDPVATSTSVIVQENGDKEITLTATDVDNEPLSFDIESDPVLGSLSTISTPVCSTGTCTAKVTYTAFANEVGDDAFSFLVDDGNGGTDSAIVDVTIEPATPPSQMDLKVTKVSTLSSVAVGDLIGYTIKVKNIGTDPAETVTLDDALPEGMRLESVATTKGTCSGVARNATGTVTCSLGTLNAGAEATITVKGAHVTAGLITNEAAALSTTEDADPANNTASVTTSVTGFTCTIVGTFDHDVPLLGTGGDDVICGLAGNDIINGKLGNDKTYGNSGNDRFIGVPGNDLYDGGEGVDTVTFAAAKTSVTASLTDGKATGQGTDTLVSIENLFGSAWNDHLTGDAKKNTLSGGGGADKLFGLANDDNLLGGDGADLLNGGTGIDSANGGKGQDTCKKTDSNRSC